MTSITTAVSSTMATSSSTLRECLTPSTIRSAFFDTVIKTIDCAIIAVSFTSVGVLGGAIFGATNFLSTRAIDWICDQIPIAKDHLLYKACQVALYALSTFASIGAGVLIATTLGFPMTFSTGMLLTIGTLFLHRVSEVGILAFRGA